MAKSIEAQIDSLFKKNLKAAKKLGGKYSSLTSDTIDFNEVLKNEAKKFHMILQEEINNYYQSYPNPVRYKRTNKLAESLDIVKVSDGKAYIKFNKNAYHKSLFSDKESFVPSLINYGWKWKHQKRKIKRFTYYEGYHFIQKAIEKYLAEAQYPITIEIYDSANKRNNKEYNNF